LLISGEAGVGKTRLVQEFSARQRWEGIRVLEGRCYEFERLLPYQPVAEALRSLPPALASSVAAELPEWISAQVALMAPDLLGRQPDLALAPASQPGQEQTRLFEGICRFLALLAARESLLVVFEDLQWATESTLELLHYLARQLNDQPLLFVGSLRPEAVPAAHPLAAIGRRLERDGLARRLRLPRLSAAEVETLIGQLSGEGDRIRPLAQRLYQETEGNPFFLIESIRTLFERGDIRLEGGVWQADFARLSQAELPLPTTVGETILARVLRLREDTQDAVRLASVVGKEFDFAVLQGAWAQGEERSLVALDDLLRQQLIAEGTGPSDADYAFTHHKIQEVIYGGLSLHRRLHLHGKVGAAMERCAAGNVGELVGDLAFHFEQACLLDRNLTEKAVDYLQQAGDAASASYAHREAINFYQRALASLDDAPSARDGGRFRQQATARLQERLGDALGSIGSRGAAQSAYRLALDDTHENEPLQRSQLYLKLAALINRAEDDKAWLIVDAAEAALGDQPEDPTSDWWEAWLEVQIQRAMLRYTRMEPQEMNSLVRRIRPAVEAHGNPVQRSWLFGLLGNSGFGIDRYVPTAQTLDYCKASLVAAQEAGDHRRLYMARFQLGFALLWAGRLDEAEANLSESLDCALRAGMLDDQLVCLVYLTLLSRKRLRVREAEALALRSLKLAQQAELPYYIVPSRGTLAWVAWREGDVPKAENEGRIALQIWQERETGKYPFVWTALWPLIGVAMARQELSRAIGHVDLLLDEKQQRLPEAMTAALQAATTAWSKGQQDQAREHMNKAAAVAADLGYL
jgi:tetratricopeptide (TPR) repeat protein